MRNAESKMWNQKCGMTLFGGAINHVTAVIPQITTPVSTGSAVKCRPAVQKRSGYRTVKTAPEHRSA